MIVAVLRLILFCSRGVAPEDTPKSHSDYLLRNSFIVNQVVTMSVIDLSLLLTDYLLDLALIEFTMLAILLLLRDSIKRPNGALLVKLAAS